MVDTNFDNNMSISANFTKPLNGSKFKCLKQNSNFIFIEVPVQILSMAKYIYNTSRIIMYQVHCVTNVRASTIGSKFLQCNIWKKS